MFEIVELFLYFAQDGELDYLMCRIYIVRKNQVFMQPFSIKNGETLQCHSEGKKIQIIFPDKMAMFAYIFKKRYVALQTL